MSTKNNDEVIEIPESKMYAIIAGLMDSFQSAEIPISIYRNCRLLAVGNLQWLIYHGIKIWHIENILSFSFEEVKEVQFSVETGYAIYLKG